MEPKNTIPTWNSIRTKLLLVFLGLTSAALLVSIYIATTTLFTARNAAQEVSQTTLKEQAAEFAVQIIEKTAQQNDSTLQLIQQDAHYLASYLTDVYANGEAFLESSQWRADEKMRLLEDGQFANDETDTVSVYVPNTVSINEDLIASLELSSYIDYQLRSIYENSDNITAIYFGTEDQITRYYPNINLGKVLPPDFEVTQRPWYVNAVTDNPGDEVAWSEIYEDATGQGFLVTAAIPVYRAEKQAGVIGIDVSLGDIQTTVENTQLLENSYSLLIDENGQVIVMPEQGYVDFFGQSSESFETAPTINESSPSFQPLVESMLAQETGYKEITINDNALFVVYAPLQSTGWSLATVIPTDQLLERASTLQEDLEENVRQLVLTRLVVTGVLLLGITFLIGLWATNRLVTPIQTLVSAVQRIGERDWAALLPRKRKDEIGVLARTFQDVGGQLQDTLSGLEKRIAERTQNLERRAVQLQAAAEVGHAATTMRDIEELLSQVTHLISERFGFYHAGIFLMDEEQEYAVLQAANSPGGQKMLTRGHRLKVGEVGIVGYVTAQQEARIALDVGEDAVFFDNPDLPETRSEMALPLIAGGELLGALDVQSKREAAFSEEDISVLQTLADQIAVAIDNARLLTERQEALESAQRAFGELTREGWGKLLREEQDLGFLSTMAQEARPSKGLWDDGMLEATHRKEITRVDPHTIALPIILRDQVLGAVRLKKPLEASPWRDDEIELMDTLIDQLENALESARLYRETQQRAQRERLVTDITTKIRSTTDPNQMLKTAVEELKQALNTTQAHFVLPEAEE